MKNLLFILFVLISAMATAQNITRYGNANINLLSNEHSFHVGSDSIAKFRQRDVKLYKPLYCGVWTTAGRPSPAVAGYFGYNSDSGRIEWHNGSAWAQSGNAIPSADHGTLTGLADDDHTQYALLAGRAGGQTLTGGPNSGDDLTLLSTSHGTKGNLFFGTAATYDQVNDRWGFSTLAPTHAVTLGRTAALDGIALYQSADQTVNFGRHVIKETSSGGNPQLIFDAQAGGTVTANGYSFRISNVSKLDMDGSNAIWAIGNLAAADATYDLSGRVSASPLRFRNAYLSGGIQLGAPANTSLARPIHAYANDAVTNALSPVARFEHVTSGTAAAGSGPSFEYYAETAGGTPESIGLVGFPLTTATNGAPVSDMVVHLSNGGAPAEKFRILGSGAAKFNNAFTFPTADGSSGQVLQTNGSGTVSWQNDVNLGNTNLTLSGNRTLSGAGNSLELGTSGSSFSTLTLRSAGLVNLFGTLNFSSSFTSTDANYTLLDGSAFVTLIEITSNRTVVLPTATAGKFLIIWNQNSSGNNWSFGGGGATVTDAAGASITTLTNDAVYILIGTGSAFLKIN